jgi:pSer/pThr/pTyr-binding forkhead associated (FHA) protein
VVQLKILSGKKAGFSWEARRFPVRIGRAATADLQLDEAGVWDNHLQLEFDPTQGIVLRVQSGAWVLVNGQRLEQGLLRNGDALEIGALRLQFWLGHTRQGNLSLREGFSWSLIVAVSMAQVALIYWLLR